MWWSADQWAQRQSGGGEPPQWSWSGKGWWQDNGVGEQWQGQGSGDGQRSGHWQGGQGSRDVADGGSAAAFGIGKGKGGGGGNGDGKSSLGGKNSGRELLTSKGKTCRANWFKGKMGGPQTDAQKGRAKKSEWYRDQAAQGVGVSAQEEDPSDFQLEVPWPHSYKEMGSEFMTHWKTEAESRGFSLRLSAYRNRTWRDHPEQAAGFSRLVLTALDRTKMHRWDAVQILCDMAVASAQRPVPVNTLPWGDIIKWWDGEDPQRA